ncbi:hypothetical protein GCM10023160_20620 [Brachybacterium paraconglomeratum]|uniref:hypothetical protein n=1 Tax=Brachybacterium paraconglomeratum TaxID=173362 RepID=UPI0031EC08ED
MFSPPRPLDGGTPLYVAPTRSYRRLMLALLGVLVVLALVVFALIVVVAWQMAAQLSLMAAVVTLAVFGVLLLVLLVLITINAALQSSMIFAVTTQGLTVATPYRRARFVPWAQVAALEPSPGRLMRGAVVAVLADGSRLTASLTNASLGYAHPAAPPHLSSPHPGPGAAAPVPLRAALDGLARYRRGEFADASLRAPAPRAASNGSAAQPPAC